MFKTKNEYSSAMTKRVWFERFYLYIYTRQDAYVQQTVVRPKIIYRLCELWVRTL